MKAIVLASIMFVSQLVLLVLLRQAQTQRDAAIANAQKWREIAEQAISMVKRCDIQRDVAIRTAQEWKSTSSINERTIERWQEVNRRNEHTIANLMNILGKPPMPQDGARLKE